MFDALFGWLVKVFGGYTSKEYQDQYDRLTAEIDELEETIKRINDRCESFQSRYEEASSKLTSAQDEIASLKEELEQYAGADYYCQCSYVALLQHASCHGIAALVHEVEEGGEYGIAACYCVSVCDACYYQRG